MESGDRPTPASAARALRVALARPQPLVIVGAHNGLSAKLVAEAGFDGIWASGFEISAAHGVPDANILTMAESLEAAVEMARAVAIPVVADCDNGFGNAVNVIRAVHEYEAGGVAGICIEDNVFPKRCSFYEGARRELAAAEEHAGKVRAAKDAARSDDFVVVARTEALIAGWGMEEALRRGRAYADAGADLVLVHSKSRTPEEVLEFARRWDRPAPLVAVPTIYRETTVETLAAGGIKVVIFANHALRSAVKAMRETLGVLRDAGRASAVEDRVAPLSAVYALVGVPELERQESAYLPPTERGVRAVVLAAGGSAVEGVGAAGLPRSMLEVGGRTVLGRQVEALRAAGVRDVAVVRGHAGARVEAAGVRFHENPDWERTGELASLLAARDEIQGPFLCAYGDVLFEPWVVERLLGTAQDVAIVVDRSSIAGLGPAERAGRDLVVPTPLPSLLERLLADADPPLLRAIGRRVAADEAAAEFVGLALFSRRGAECARRVLARWDPESLATAEVPDLLQRLVDDGVAVSCVEVAGGWAEIDTFEDFLRARETVRP